MFLSNVSDIHYIYSTYTKVGDSLAWYFVSFQMNKAFGVRQLDFWPPLASSVPLTESGSNHALVVHRLFGAPSCVNGTDAVKSGCVLVSQMPRNGADIVLTAPASDFGNTTGATDLKPDLSTVWRSCPNGWTLLGELDKYVALSPARFSAIRCTNSGLSGCIHGRSGEVVSVTALGPPEPKIAGTSTTQQNPPMIQKVHAMIMAISPSTSTCFHW